MNKIKLLVDAHVFDDSYQGTTTYLKGLYSALAKDDAFEITLAAHNIEHLKTVFTNPAFKFHRLTAGSKYKRLASELPALIRVKRFDFAHFQYITPLLHKCCYINTIHDLLFLDFPDYFPFSYRFTKKYIFKMSARKSDIICTVSEYSRQALVKHFGISHNKITVTPNAVDLPVTTAVDIRAKHQLDKYILFVSRMEPRKNHYGMLKVFVELELYRQGYKLVFVGRTNDVGADVYHTYLAGLSPEIKNAVKHIENISYDELAGFYKYASLFVYPSLAEGFGIPPLEAALMNCKVLCSDKTAMADFTFFGNYLFNPEDMEEWKRKTLAILSDNSYPFEQIRKAVTETYNWQTIADHFAEKIKSHFQSIEH